MQIPRKTLRDEYTFKKGKLYFYDDLVIGEIYEGAHISANTLLSFFEFFLENYKKPFGYISYRKHSYSIDPKIYREIPDNPLLKGIAIVSEHKFSLMNAQIEKQLFSGNMEVFQSLEVAVNWLDTVVQKHNSEVNKDINPTL